ncbi:MAG: hydroxyacylglutathione hydrolase [Betaproteobacteria bacterium]|nr:hydroxyacylglutathione hydrolase [Betaproteobacteria bacterium]
MQTVTPGRAATLPADEVRIVPLPAFRDNYIWLLQRGQVAAVVDPGDGAPVLAALSELGLRLEAILLTHHHADHVGGVETLLAAWPQGARPLVFGPAAESIIGVTQPLVGDESISLPGLGLEFQVLAVPGHTRGHLAYFCQLAGQPALFCGDTLFGAGCGRLFEGTPSQMALSLARIASLPDATAIYCAHEYTAMNLGFAVAVEPHNPDISRRVAAVAEQRRRGQPTLPSTLALEKATNPFLRCAQPEVIAAARRQGASGDDPVSVFAALREWRNQF